MPKRINLEPGDLFKFPAGQDGCGVGQVIELAQDNGVFLTTILSSLYPLEVEVGEVNPSDILLCGWTMDGRLHNGSWKIFGNRAIPTVAIPRPCTKVSIEGKIWIQDYRGTPIRKARKKEAAGLEFHMSRSPMGFESAFLAYHGQTEWREDFNRLTLAHQSAQAAITERSRILSCLS